MESVRVSDMSFTSVITVGIDKRKHTCFLSVQRQSMWQLKWHTGVKQYVSESNIPVPRICPFIKRVIYIVAICKYICLMVFMLYLPLKLCNISYKIFKITRQIGIGIKWQHVPAPKLWSLYRIWVVIGTNTHEISWNVSESTAMISDSSVFQKSYF